MMACVLAFILVRLLGSKSVRSIKGTVGGTKLVKRVKFSINSVTTSASLAGKLPQQGGS